MKKIFSLLLSLLILIAAFPISAYANDGVLLKRNSFNLGIDETLDLLTVIKDENKENIIYKYSSSDKKVASVSEKGKVKAKSKGTAEITIKNKSKKAVIKIRVKEGAKEVTLNQSSVKIGIGEVIDLDSTVSGGYSYKRAYETTDKSVASVKAGGIVTGVNVGTATIKVKTYNNRTATCKVTVCKEPKSIKITNANTLIQKNSDNHKIKFKLSSGSASYHITYSVKDKSIATVDENGYIHANKNGKTTVSVKTYNGIKAEQEITVKNDSLSLNVNSTQIALDNDSVEKIKYGKSEQGRNLEGFVITNGDSYKKTLFMDFAIHGFEDSYDRDGKKLVEEANALIKYYSAHTDKLGKFRLVIVPCANPDGTIAGKNNLHSGSSAFGRCTSKHVDMNRDFGKFKGLETRALRDFIKQEEPSIYLNMHGWLNEAIGTKKLNEIVCSELGLSKKQNGVYCTTQGYAIGWVYKNLNIPVCLVEYKSPKSVSTSKDVKMINKIIQEYS